MLARVCERTCEGVCARACAMCVLGEEGRDCVCVGVRVCLREQKRGKRKSVMVRRKDTLCKLCECVCVCVSTCLQQQL